MNAQGGETGKKPDRRADRLPRRWVVVLVLGILLSSSLLVSAAFFISPTHPSQPAQPSPIVPALANPTVDAAVKSVCAAVTVCQVGSGGGAAITYAGDSEFIFVSFNISSPPTWTVQDSQHDTYHVIAWAKTLNLNLTVWATYNMPRSYAAGALSLWVNASVSSTYAAAAVSLYGVPYNPIDAIGTANSGPHSMSFTASATANVASDMVVGAVAIGGTSTTTAGTATTLLDYQSGTPAVADGYSLPGSTGSKTVTLTGATSRAWDMIAFSVKLGSVPPAPTGFAVGSFTTTQIVFTWTPATGAVANQTYAKFTLSSGSCVYSSSGNVAAGTNTVTFTGLTTNTGYGITVNDWNSTGEGPASACFVAYTGSSPNAPTGLTSTTATTTTVTLGWTNPTCSPAATCTLVNDTIEYGTVCATPTLFISTGTAVSSYTVTSLTSGTVECYAVVAWNSTGTSPRSATYSIASGPAKTPTSLTLGALTTTTAALTWTQPTNSGTLANSTIYIWAGNACSGATYAQENNPGGSGSGTATGLLTGGQYSVEVTTWNVVGQSPKSNCVTFTTNEVPAAPSSLVISGATATTMTFAWSLPGGGGLLNETFYWAAGGTTGGACSNAVTPIPLSGTPTGYVLTGRSAATQYCGSVTAWNATGQSPKATAVSGYTAPAAPTSLMATTATSTQINLAWTNPGGTLTDNHVYVFMGGSCGGSPSGIDMGSVVTFYDVTGLVSSTLYSFETTASNSGGESVGSNCASATTYDPVPAAPTGLTVVTVSTSTLGLSWTNPSGTLTDNHVYEYAGASCGGSTTSHDIGSVATSYDQGGLSAGTTYSFTVSASTSGGEGAPSSCASGATFNAVPGKPTIVSAAALSDSTIKLTWTNPAGSILGDNATIYSSGCAARLNTYQLGIVTTYTFTGLSHDTAYCVTVDASTNGGQGLNATPYQNVTTDFAPPSAPAKVWANTTGTFSIQVSWIAASPGTIVNYTVIWGLYGGALGNWTSTGVVLTVTISGLNANTHYSFAVSAWTNGGESAPSSTVSNTTATNIGPITPGAGAQAALILTVVAATWIGGMVIILGSWAKRKWRT